MKYAEWFNTVPSEITNDPIWKLEIYRLALFADDIGWQDVLVLSKNKLMWSVADQLHRSLGLTTHIIGMLTPMIPHQRKNAIREEQAEYNIPPQPSDFSLDSEVPLP